MTTATLWMMWLGTAGFLVRYRGQELLLDPFLSRPPGSVPEITARPEDFGAVSLILVSHGHFDHAMDVARLTRVSRAQVYAPLKTCTILRSQGLDPGLLHPNEKHEALEWNRASIRIVPSRHIRFDLPLILKTLGKSIQGRTFFKILRLARDYPMGSNSDFLMEFDGYRVLFSGSGGGDWASLALLRPDCFLIPFAGRSDLIEYYLNAVEILHPQTVVLHHFDTFFPSFCVEYPVEEFRTKALRAFAGLRVIVPEAEKSFTLP